MAGLVPSYAIGADFLTVEVLTLAGLKRYLAFFVIELQTRRVQMAGIHPPGPALGGANGPHAHGSR